MAIRFTRSWEWGPLDRISAFPFKKKKQELVYFLPNPTTTVWRHIKGDCLQPKERAAVPGSWPCTSSLQNCEKINFCCLSHPVYGILRQTEMINISVYFTQKSYDKPRQHIKKQIHYFANKGPHSQSYGLSWSHVQMWELDHTEVWVPKNQIHLNCGVGEDSWEFLELQGDTASES